MTTSHTLRLNDRVNLTLRPEECTPDELSSLLTATFGAGESGLAKAVALEDENHVVFPLQAVASRPDALEGKSLKVLFSMTPATTLLGELEEKRELTEREVKVLKPLCEDPFVVAALEVYKSERDLDDLVDTLQRIVAIRTGVPVKGGEKDAEEHPVATKSDLQAKLSNAMRLTEFPQQELFEIVNRFGVAKALEKEEVAILIALINKHLPHLQAAFEVFLDDRNEGHLLRTFKRMALIFGVSRVARGLPHEDLLFNAFVGGDPAVCGAWDVYVDEHDEEDFRDSLARCAVRLAKKLSATGHSSTRPPPTEAKVALRRFVIWLHQGDKITAEEGQALMRVVDNGSPAAEAAAEVFLNSKRSEVDGERLSHVMFALVRGGEADEEEEEDEEEEDEDDTEEMASEKLNDEEREAIDKDMILREGLYQFLEFMVTDGALSSKQALKLSTLVDSYDDRLFAALEVFREEQNLEDLIETLARLADKVELVGQHVDELDEVDDMVDDSVEDEEEDDEDFIKEEEIDYNLAALLDVVVRMGLTSAQLEVVRDAMVDHHPAIDDIIDNFAATEDEDAFRHELQMFAETQADE